MTLGRAEEGARSPTTRISHQLSHPISCSKGAAFIVSEASRSIHDLQKGIEAQANTINEGARSRLGGGVRRMQARLAGGGDESACARAFLSNHPPSRRRRPARVQLYAVALSPPPATPTLNKHKTTTTTHKQQNKTTERAARHRGAGAGVPAPAARARPHRRAGAQPAAGRRHPGVCCVCCVLRAMRGGGRGEKSFARALHNKPRLSLSLPETKKRSHNNNP